MLQTFVLSLLISINSIADAKEVQNVSVNLAWRLYNDCITATLKSSVPKLKSDIDKLMIQLDELCLQWTIVWYPIEDDKIVFWSFAKHLMFDKRRVALMNDIKNKLISIAAK